MKNVHVIKPVPVFSSPPYPSHPHLHLILEGEAQAINQGALISLFPYQARSLIETILWAINKFVQLESSKDVCFL